MDIDDILDSVSGPSSIAPELSDLQQLTRAWVNEKCAPELLAWPAELMERSLERIQKQIELVEEQTGDMDPSINFRLIILQTELERQKFLVRSFLRLRLGKIDLHAAHYLSTVDSDPGLLSGHERAYAERHQALLAGHFNASFLNAFPPQLQRLDDTAGGISMVEAPDVDKAVFARALRDGAEEVDVDGTDIYFEMRKGMIYATRWSAVRERVLKGDAELI